MLREHFYQLGIDEIVKNKASRGLYMDFIALYPIKLGTFSVRISYYFRSQDKLGAQNMGACSA